MNINTLTVGGVNLHTFMDDITAKIEPVTYNNAAAHNSLYRGKNLGTAITAEHYAAIKAKTFTDLYPGDYWNINIGDATITATIRLLLPAQYDYNPNNPWGTVSCAVVSFSCGRIQINDTATCEGHLYNSKAFTETMPAIVSKLENAIGTKHMLTIYENVADSINDSGIVNHRREQTPCKLFLPSPANMGYDYDGYDNRYAYAHVSRLKWATGHHLLGGVFPFCANVNKTQWLTKMHPGYGTRAWEADKSFETIYYFFLRS